MEEEEYIGNVIKGKGKFDWFSGANSPIVKEVLISDFNWKPYHIEHEVQFINTNKPYDTQSCVSFSANKIIATLLMYYLGKGLISLENVTWLKNNGYFQNGFINFNERFTSCNGQTNARGASLFNVANGIYNFGLIPQPLLSYPETFYEFIDGRDITAEMKDLGKEFKKRFPINYEWVDDVSYLKYGPLQGIVRFANYTNLEDILNPAGATNHAIEIVYKTDEYTEIDDSYWQTYKRYVPNKVFDFMLYNITINNNNYMDTITWLKTNDKKWVRNSNTGQFGRVLQNKLMVVLSTDRGTLMLLDDKVRENGVQITNAEWNQLPKINF